jgi:hypothetical protein
MGIPTRVEITTKQGKVLDSGMVLHPGGHARNTTIALHGVLQSKFKSMGVMAMEKQELIRFKVELENIGLMSHEELRDIYDRNLKFTDYPIDEEPRDSSSSDSDEEDKKSSKQRKVK